MTHLAHKSIINWAARRGIIVEFSTHEFLADCRRTEEFLKRDADDAPHHVIDITAVNLDRLKRPCRGDSDETTERNEQYDLTQHD